MGSFYATCSITGHTINNQRTCLQLLLPRYRNKYVDESKGLVINSLDSSIFIAFGFPIIGTYSDCGMIEGIDKNEYTQKLESFFNLPIEYILFPSIYNIDEDSFDSEMISSINNDQNRSKSPMSYSEITDLVSNIKNKGLLVDTRVTYFTESVYNHLSKGSENLITDPSKIKNLGHFWEPENAFLKSWEAISWLNMDSFKKEEILQERIVKKIEQEGLEKDKPLTKKERLTVRYMVEFSIDYDPTTFSRYKTYINASIDKDFITLLKLPADKFETEFKKHFLFIHSLHNKMNIGFRLSSCGNQETNFRYIRDFNRLLDEDLDQYMIDSEDLTEEEEFELDLKRKLFNRNDQLNNILDKGYSTKDVFKIVNELVGQGNYKKEKLINILNKKNHE